jgi:hypothetical protein
VLHLRPIQVRDVAVQVIFDLPKSQYHSRMKTTLRAEVTLIALLVFSLSLHADSERSRDGNWWRTLTASEKATYMIGFFDKPWYLLLDPLK